MPIYMRITVGGNCSELPTNRDCDPKRWNAKGNRTIGSKEETKALNTHLDQLQNAIYYAHQCVFDMGLPITADAIKSSFLGTLSNSHILLEAVAVHNEKMEQLVGKDYFRGTRNRSFVVFRGLLLKYIAKVQQFDQLIIENIISFSSSPSGDSPATMQQKLEFRKLPSSKSRIEESREAFGELSFFHKIF